MADVHAVAEGAETAFGSLESLVNNEGIGPVRQALESLSEHAFELLNKVNMKVLYLVI